MTNELKKECGIGMYWCNTDQKCKPMQEDARIPKKPGQPDKSDKHSDLYTDEDPKGTIHGLKFATTQDAKESVSKIKNSGRSHAHKIQAAIAMEQRARVMGKTEAAGVYRGFINSMKKKTKDMREDWSQKYKKSIDCNNPKGFSQKAHCQGRKKQMSEEMKNKKPFKLPIPLELLKAYGKAMKQVPGSPRQKETLAHIEKLRSNIKEDMPANVAGGGDVAGLGVGSQGEPGVNKKKGLTPFLSFIRRKKPQ